MGQYDAIASSAKVSSAKGCAVLIQAMLILEVAVVRDVQRCHRAMRCSTDIMGYAASTVVRHAVLRWARMLVPGCAVPGTEAALSTEIVYAATRTRMQCGVRRSAMLLPCSVLR